VRRGHLDVFNGAAAIALLVLDADVGKFHVSVPAWQLSFTSPVLDLLRLPFWPPRSVVAATIGRLQEALIFALQFLFEDHATDLSASGYEPFGTLDVRSIQADVMRQFARFRDAGVESLTGVVSSVPSPVFQH
jgi:hypothetical protein